MSQNEEMKTEAVTEEIHHEVSESEQEQTLNNEESQSLASGEQEESYQQKNFRELREAKEQIEKERDELIRKMQQNEQANTQQKEPDIDPYSLSPDELIEARHLQSISKEIKELKQSNMETRLRSEYKDFDAVVSNENVKKFKELYPEVASTLRNSSNVYEMGAAAYKLIKNLGIAQPNSYTQEKQRIDNNIKKPRPLNSIAPQKGTDPLSKANAFARGLTPELKKQLLKEMEEATKYL